MKLTRYPVEYLGITKCALCGETYTRHQEHAYYARKRGVKYYLCSYTCMRKARGEIK